MWMCYLEIVIHLFIYLFIYLLLTRILLNAVMLHWFPFCSGYSNNLKLFAFVHCCHKMKYSCYQESLVIQSCFVYLLLFFLVEKGVAFHAKNAYVGD